MSTTTVDLQITEFHNCNRCLGNVVRALNGFHGVKVLEAGFENGKFTIKTSRNPEEIRAALQRFVGKSVFLSNRIDRSNQPRNSSNHGPLNFHDMTEELTAVSRANGVQCVEFTQSSSIRFNFNNQPTTSRTTTNAPRSRPPPPPQQQHQLATYGSPWADGYDSDGNEDFGYGLV